MKSLKTHNLVFHSPTTKDLHPSSYMLLIKYTYTVLRGLEDKHNDSILDEPKSHTQTRKNQPMFCDSQ